MDAAHRRESSRLGEVATFLVLMVFNLHFVFLNTRLWTQLISLLRQCTPLFRKTQSGFATATIRGNTVPPSTPLVNCTIMVRISDRLLDKSLDYLQLAGWYAWWSQDCSAAKEIWCNPDLDMRDTERRAQDLPERGPRWPSNPLGKVFSHTGQCIPRGDRVAWEKALFLSGSDAGEQDTFGPPCRDVFRLPYRSGIPTLVYEKTKVLPHRMTLLWYRRERFEDLYSRLFFGLDERVGPRMKSDAFSTWKEISFDIARRLTDPLHLSGEELVAYAGELASASILPTEFPSEFRDLVDIVYEDGRTGR